MMDGGGWWWMSGGSLLLLIVVVLLAWALVRHDGSAPTTATPPQRHGAQEVLAERLARGEIDEKEYRSRLSALRE
jgi:putative membrane protein